MPDDGTNLGMATLAVSLDGTRRSERTVALCERLREAVRSGALRAGTRLPPSRQLASDLGVSRGVVVRAYEQLVAEGYLLAQQGRGTTVAAVDADEPTAPPRPKPPMSNPGLPAGSTFPRRAWLRAATRVLARLPDADLGYGDPAGHPRLRHELASYLGRVRAVIAPPERIVIVNGFAQASRVLADVLQDRGIRDIAMEDPGSAGLRTQLTRADLTCHPITVDAEGIRVDELERSGLSVVVVTPAHQFPTGVVLSPERRHALLRWATTTDGLIVEDDYDAEFRYDRAPVGALQGLGPEHVIHGGSVSKTLAPGLRLGWLVLPDRLVEPFASAKYDVDLATGVLDQAILADLLASGEFERHLRRMAMRYRERRDALVDALATYLPSWSVTGTAAGLHLLVHPPPGSDEADLAHRAAMSGFDARPLSDYALATQPLPGLVVGYGHRPPDALVAAVRALARTEHHEPA